MGNTATAKTQKSSRTKKMSQEIFTYVLIHDFAGRKIKNTNAANIEDIRKTIKSIDFQIEEINSINKQKEIIICLGFASHYIIKHIQSKHINKNVKIIENSSFLESNSCESLRVILNCITGKRIVIINGCNNVNKKIISRVRDNNCYAVVSKKRNNIDNIGVNISHGNKIEYFSFGGCQEWKNCLLLFSKPTINTLKKKLNSGEYKNKIIFEILNDLIEDHASIQAIQTQ